MVAAHDQYYLSLLDLNRPAFLFLPSDSNPSCADLKAGNSGP
ncbi:putative 2-component response regulator [Desulforapulum autotrophicum HRM2]|uniref:2-component response regulator n=1 Tax=Desulforapulum autotrophicum (strain ATCC 43914 / DSM 3382 / VKM B-1955 / HRM2) TaxID=177437 RepID=C0QDA2_DESAH|nr:putative 2-component response regulator [Desulforapulum autotrophicum HRM2]